ncbi:hypothetical protein HTY52_18015 [Cupriavidus taiwanensis]|uniref:hypothetical protein n=1 Tax=Cupriavidus taiwanensis TaxID=164546 RepID=UPI001573F76B|nr:hypothetical protein [Cupriavidus taiwanensis]NSX15983.1 hypothetical protein [Cupriavidus taiwanensis]
MDLTKIAGLFGGWALVNAVLYLSVYYGAFEINPFQFVSISDAIGPAVKMLIPAAFSLIIASLSADHNPLNRWTLSKTPFFPLVGAVVIMLLLTMERLLLDAPYWIYYCLGALVGFGVVVVGLGAANWLLLVQRIKDPTVRTLVCIASISMPIFVIFVGINSAKEVIDGKRFSYLTADQLPAPFTGSQSNRYRLIGKLGSTWLLMSERDRTAVIMVDSSKLQSVSVTHVRNLPTRFGL